MEKVIFLFGFGANGKSVFFEVLSGVIGLNNISNYSLESLTDDKGYSRAMIKDKIVNYGTDISDKLAFILSVVCQGRVCFVWWRIFYNSFS